MPPLLQSVLFDAIPPHQRFKHTPCYQLSWLTCQNFCKFGSWVGEQTGMAIIGDIPGNLKQLVISAKGNGQVYSICEAVD